MKDVIKETQDEQDIKTRTAVFQNFESGDDIGISLIQRKCRCGYFSASRVLENLIEDGLVEEGKTYRGVKQFSKDLIKINDLTFVSDNN